MPGMAFGRPIPECAALPQASHRRSRGFLRGGECSGGAGAFVGEEDAEGATIGSSGGGTRGSARWGEEGRGRGRVALGF